VTARPSRRPRPGAERGAALLVVMVAIAVITALAVDLAYESRVSLRIAANARDELRASYQARSGVALSRLVLSFQQKFDARMPQGQLANVAGLGVPRVQLWRIIPVGSTLATSLFPGAFADAPGGPHGAVTEGGFEANVEDEAAKVNAQLDVLQGMTQAPIAAAQVQAFYQLICDARWDPLFEREDANGVRTTREELLTRLRDWADNDPEQSGLKAGFSGTPCGTIIGEPPFERAYGDENQPYDRGEDRYKAKNARMDSLDELFLVAGVGDAFMAAFGDALTVYLPPDAKRQVNDLDRTRMMVSASILTSISPFILDQTVGDVLYAAMMEKTYGGYFSIDPGAFGQLVQLAVAQAGVAGVQINQNLLGQNGLFTDRSTSFRIRASGKAGDVTSAIDAVVWLENPQQGVPVAAPGRLVYWKED
jgi:general secretion pathway protein K